MSTPRSLIIVTGPAGFDGHAPRDSERRAADVAGRGQSRRMVSTRTLASVTAISLSLMTLLACGASRISGTRRAGTVPDAETRDDLKADDLNALYADAIRRSAVISPEDALPLVPLVAGPDGTVTVTTWADCAGAGGPTRCGRHVPGRAILVEDVWVGDHDEFRRACRTLSGDLVLKLDQLIGLPPPRKPLPPDTMEWQFVTFSAVPVLSVFRPCTDPRVDTDWCSGTTLPPTLPPNAPPDYYKWFTNQAMSSWQVPSKGRGAAGYPWTRLGYTYNWAPGASSRYGLSEYVISGGSRPVTVNIVSVQTAKAYCRNPE
jgi:hypothetical protein